MGIGSLEFCLPFLDSVYSGVEIQEFPILAHHVFGMLQEFLRGWIAECHVACRFTPVASKAPSDTAFRVLPQII